MSVTYLNLANLADYQRGRDLEWEKAKEDAAAEGPDALIGLLLRKNEELFVELSQVQEQLDLAKQRAWTDAERALFDAALNVPYFSSLPDGFISAQSEVHKERQDPALVEEWLRIRLQGKAAFARSRSIMLRIGSHPMSEQQVDAIFRERYNEDGSPKDGAR